MARFDLLDEYTSIVQPGYGPRRSEVSETTGRNYSASLATLLVLALGAVLMLSSLHGFTSTDPDHGIEVADHERK
jgi:hypothetical protein